MCGKNIDLYCSHMVTISIQKCGKIIRIIEGIFNFEIFVQLCQKYVKTFKIAVGIKRTLICTAFGKVMQ